MNEHKFKGTTCYYCPQYFKDGLEYCLWACYIQRKVNGRLTRKAYAEWVYSTYVEAKTYKTEQTYL